MHVFCRCTRSLGFASVSVAFASNFWVASFARALSVHIADVPQPPCVSATIGMKLIPWLMQSCSVSKWALLNCSYAAAAAPWVAEDATIMSRRCGDVMAKSSAAGRPCFHEGR